MPGGPRSSTRAATAAAAAAAAAASLKKVAQSSNSQNQHDGNNESPLNKTNADEMSSPTVRIPGHLRPISKTKRPVPQYGFEGDEDELQQADQDQNTENTEEPAKPHPRRKKLKQSSSRAPDDISTSMGAGAVGSASMYELDQDQATIDQETMRNGGQCNTMVRHDTEQAEGEHDCLGSHAGITVSPPHQDLQPQSRLWSALDSLIGLHRPRPQLISPPVAPVYILEPDMRQSRAAMAEAIRVIQSDLERLEHQLSATRSVLGTLQHNVFDRRATLDQQVVVREAIELRLHCIAKKTKTAADSALARDIWLHYSEAAESSASAEPASVHIHPEDGNDDGSRRRASSSPAAADEEVALHAQKLQRLKVDAGDREMALGQASAQLEDATAALLAAQTRLKEFSTAKQRQESCFAAMVQRCTENLKTMHGWMTW